MGTVGMKERDEAFIRLRREGKTLAEIGRIHGISKQRVQQRMKQIRRGAGLLSASTRGVVFPEIIAAMETQESSMADISRVTGIKYWALRLTLKGARPIKRSEALKIAEYFDGDADELFIREA